MIDEVITTPAGLSAAEDAVCYILKRIKVDADLRHHMLHTEAFSKLCAAEAHRTGTPKNEIDCYFSEPAPHCRHDGPRLIQCQEVIVEAVRVLRDRHIGDRLWGADLIDRLERAC